MKDPHRLLLADLRATIANLRGDGVDAREVVVGVAADGVDALLDALDGAIAHRKGQTPEQRRGYYAANREAILARGRARRNLNLERERARSRAERAKPGRREAIRAQSRAHYAANREKILAKQRERRRRKP